VHRQLHLGVEQPVLRELLEVPVMVALLGVESIVPARARPMIFPFSEKYW
jgi:hypothetical protein